MSDRSPSLPRTPALARLLAATRTALTRQVYAYGIGTVLGIATLWLAFAFLADWGLRVPYLVRVLHGVVFVVLLGVYLWRDLLRPLRALPDEEGLALLHERAHPGLQQLLISAVQFQRADAPTPEAPELVGAVVAAAEARAAALTPRAVIDPEAPRARLLLGLGGLAAMAGFALWNPLYARTFLARLWGASAAWPQRTHLTLEIPGLDPSTVVASGPERLQLRLARGTDVAVLVTARGVAPDEVTLHFEGGRDVALGPTGERTYRTLLQSCQDDLAFHVTGGDDEDGLPRVEIEVLEPPDVEGLAIHVEPPAYSGLEPTLVFDRDVEVLRGSAVTVHVLPAPRSARGRARLLPEDVRIDLAGAPFPPAADAPPDALEQVGLAFHLTPEKSLGLRIELVDDKGLENPSPGLRRIRVVEDRAPELTVLSPARSEYETIRGGAIPLRVRAEDDFALASLGWRVRTQGGTDEASEPLRAEELALEPLPAAGAGGRGVRAARDAALGSARLEVDSLAAVDPATGKAELALDSRFELEFTARDRRVPEANEGRSATVRVRIVTPEELLRRLQDRLAEVRLDALRLADDQRTKRKRIEELLDSLDGDAPADSGEEQDLAAALAGERRVSGAAQGLARALGGAAEDVLYARLDDKATRLFEFLHERNARASDARFPTETWRELARENASGALASEGFATTLVQLVGLALELSEDHAAGAVAALDRAQEGDSRSDVAAALQEALEHSQRFEAGLERLLGELAEWDNFQNVLTLARDILNRQKALRERTQEIATEK